MKPTQLNLHRFTYLQLLTVKLHQLLSIYVHSCELRNILLHVHSH